MLLVIKWCSPLNSPVTVEESYKKGGNAHFSFCSFVNIGCKLNSALCLGSFLTDGAAICFHWYKCWENAVPFFSPLPEISQKWLKKLLGSKAGRKKQNKTKKTPKNWSRKWTGISKNHKYNFWQYLSLIKDCSYLKSIWRTRTSAECSWKPHL